MTSCMVRVGAPVVQWLEDSDAGIWLHAKESERGPRPHNEDLMPVLGAILFADVRADGSVLVEVAGRDQAEALREWVNHIAWLSRMNAGEDATERGRYNSARATLRALDEFLAKAWLP